MIGAFWQDLRYAARTLRKSPGFAAAAVVTLALGIGANTTMFSVLNAVILNSLPVRMLKDPDRLVMVWETWPQFEFAAKRFPVSLETYQEWKRQSRSFEGIALYGTGKFNLTEANGDPRPQQIDACSASANLFPLLGVRPRLGRNFAAEEMQPGKGGVAIIADELYRNRFHSDPGILERTIRADGAEYQVIGVLPASFRLPAAHEGEQRINPQAWFPVNIAPPEAERRSQAYYVFGKLKREVSLDQARSEISLISKRLERADPDRRKGHGASVFPLSIEDIDPAVRRNLLLLQAAVGFVLLIACANVANLLLTRAVGREREIAIRTALGAGRLRVIRQLLSESLLLGLLGGIAGLVLAVWGLDLISALAPDSGRGFEELRIDLPVLGFTVVAMILSGLLFGLAPALRASRPDIQESLGHGGRTSGPSSNRLRAAFVVSEVALSFVLLIGAGLMIRSLLVVMQVDPGFRIDHLFTAHLSLPESKYAKPGQVAAFGDRLLDAIRRLPGVRSASLADAVPMITVMLRDYRVQGEPENPGRKTLAAYAHVREGYFEALDIRLVHGRAFTRRDIAPGAPKTVVVNEDFARVNWPGQDAIGKIVSFSDEPQRAVIGVVANTHQLGPDENGWPESYIPDAELANSILIVRTAGDPLAMTSAIEKQVWAIDRELPVHDVRTMETMLGIFTSSRRFNTALLAIFAGLALILAAVGLYGVLAYSVSVRSREIGIRVALGADRGTIARLVVRQGVALTLLGIVAGVATAVALTRAMAGMIFGVKPLDPLTFVLVGSVLAAVSIAASYFPARRAARIEPMEALRLG